MGDGRDHGAVSQRARREAGVAVSVQGFQQTAWRGSAPLPRRRPHLAAAGARACARTAGQLVRRGQGARGDGPRRRHNRVAHSESGCTGRPDTSRRSGLSGGSSTHAPPASRSGPAAARGGAKPATASSRAIQTDLVTKFSMLSGYYAVMRRCACRRTRCGSGQPPESICEPDPMELQYNAILYLWHRPNKHTPGVTRPRPCSCVVRARACLARACQAPSAAGALSTAEPRAAWILQSRDLQWLLLSTACAHEGTPYMCRKARAAKG